MDLELPAGFTDLLQEFTVQVLQDKPDDIVEFAANYFMKLKLKEKRSKDGTKRRGKGVSFQSEEVNGEENSDDEDDEEDMEPPKNRFARRQSVCAEPLNPDSDEDDENPVVYPKSDEQRKRLNDAIKNILLFKNVEPEQLNQVLDAMFEKKVQPGEHVIDQGDDGDNFYVIDRGVYDIYVKIDGQDKLVGAYNEKGSFGELALMYNTPRAATIIATSEGILWALDRVTFRRILLKAAAKKRKAHEALLENVPMLKEITDYERMNLADALMSKKFKDGDCVINQGDDADCMYFVESGMASVRIHNQLISHAEEFVTRLNRCYSFSIMDSHMVKQGAQSGHDDPTEEVELTQCTKGGYFGELALVTHKPRAASVYAVGDLVCAVLDVHAFERLLGPCMDIMKRNIDGYEEQLKKLGVGNTELR